MDGYLLPDKGDDETIVVFKDNRGLRKELLGQLAPVADVGSKMTLSKHMLIERQERIEEYEDREPENKEAPEEEWVPDEYIDVDFVPDEEPKYEVGPTIGKPRAGERR